MVSTQARERERGGKGERDRETDTHLDIQGALTDTVLIERGPGDRMEVEAPAEEDHDALYITLKEPDILCVSDRERDRERQRETESAYAYSRAFGWEVDTIWGKSIMVTWPSAFTCTSSDHRHLVEKETNSERKERADAPSS
jgi:hypothetical protein